MVFVDLSFSFSAPSPFLYFLPSLTCPGPSCSCYKSKKGKSVGSTLGSSVAFFASASGELGSRGGWAAGRLLLCGNLLAGAWEAGEREAGGHCAL